MSGHLDELEPVEVVVVHFDGADRLGEYRTHHDVRDEVRLVADPDRRLYGTFAIGRGSWRRVWGPRTIGAYLRLMRKGRRYRRHTGDSLQLGGDVVVAPDGRVAWVYLPDEPDARPTIEEVAAAVGAART